MIDWETKALTSIFYVAIGVFFVMACCFFGATLIVVLATRNAPKKKIKSGSTAGKQRIKGEF